MDSHRHSRWFNAFSTAVVVILVTSVSAADIFLEWHVAIDNTIKPVYVDQPVITINGMFPGPLINATTNDNVHVNVFNALDEPLLFTWNGIQQRLNSWQDGVSGTNCPIQPNTNWTYVFQMKDQIGTFFYFPSINFLKAAGGFGPIRVNNRDVIAVPFPKPEAEFDLLIGDWFASSYKDVRGMLKDVISAFYTEPDTMLMNGKAPYLNPTSTLHESINVSKGKTYRLRISNVGTSLSFIFRIQNHRMVLVETEGCYTDQLPLDYLDVHVGQSYSVLVTADQNSADYYMVATPRSFDLTNSSSIMAIGILHYEDSTTPANGPLPIGPDPFDIVSSINQTKSIRMNMSVGAARPNPQGTFNVTNVTISQTFILAASTLYDNITWPSYAVNNVSYLTPEVPLKLAEHMGNASSYYELDKYPTNYSNPQHVHATFVATGIHKDWIEIIFQNHFTEHMDSWHLDGFGFYVVGMGVAPWSPDFRSSYNLLDPVVRSTIQVYPEGSWTAVYAYLDNPGIWNLRSQHLKNWYLGEELYLRIYDPDPNPAKEHPPPDNLLYCGKHDSIAPAPATHHSTSSTLPQITWVHIFVIIGTIAIL